MSGFAIFGIVIGAMFVFAIIYALIAVPRRMAKGEMESAGSDSETWAKKYEDPPPS